MFPQCQLFPRILDLESKWEELILSIRPSRLFFHLGVETVVRLHRLRVRAPLCLPVGALWIWYVSYHKNTWKIDTLIMWSIYYANRKIQLFAALEFSNNNIFNCWMVCCVHIVCSLICSEFVISVHAHRPKMLKVVLTRLLTAEDGAEEFAAQMDLALQIHDVMFWKKIDFVKIAFTKWRKISYPLVALLVQVALCHRRNLVVIRHVNTAVFLSLLIFKYHNLD